MKKYVRKVKKIKPRSDIAYIYRAFGIDITDQSLKNIRQIQASDATIDLMKSNLLRGVARKNRNYKPKYINTIVAYHMLNWAPQTNNDIPLNEIWVYDLDEL